MTNAEIGQSEKILKDHVYPSYKCEICFLARHNIILNLIPFMARFERRWIDELKWDASKKDSYKEQVRKQIRKRNMVNNKIFYDWSKNITYKRSEKREKNFMELLYKNSLSLFAVCEFCSNNNKIINQL